MKSAKFRWSKVYESSEEELMAFLRARGIQADRIVVTEAGGIQQVEVKANTTIWCAEGSLSIRTPVGATALQPGDGLRLDAQNSYELLAGLTGYVCYISYQGVDNQVTL